MKTYISCLGCTKTLKLSRDDGGILDDARNVVFVFPVDLVIPPVREMSVDEQEAIVLTYPSQTYRMETKKECSDLLCCCFQEDSICFLIWNLNSDLGYPVMGITA